MAVALSIFGVSFAAFCVWLTVRIANRKERWAKWTAGILALAVVAYPLSSGPVLWLWLHEFLPSSSLPIINHVYAPALYVIPRTQVLTDFTTWYYGLWMDNDEIQKKFEALSPRERSRLKP